GDAGARVHLSVAGAARAPGARRADLPGGMSVPGPERWSELWYEGSGGERLFCRHWPADDARATLFALHGLGDHSGLYPMLGEPLTARGIEVFQPDLRGNGRSGG